jgi:predicted ATPase
MSVPKQQEIAVPRIEFLKVVNYRALKHVELRGLTPLTVFLGPNGSGKSTVFDVFAFLSECFSVGLRKAWDKRGRFKELRTRGQSGPIVIEITYRETPDTNAVTYHLAIDEDAKGPFVSEECIHWVRKHPARPFKFLDFENGAGYVISGNEPDDKAEKIREQLESRDMLAVNSLGQLAKHPRVSALRRFITGWYLSYLTADNTRGTPDAGPQERLSSEGDNLPNVIQYLKEQYPDRLSKILGILSARVPRLERVDAEPMPNGQLLLQIKDAPFERPILSKFASDGTLKMLSCLTLLYDPEPPQLIGMEEPENQLHPRLLIGLAEECRRSAEASQLMVTTHSPHFVSGINPRELWVLYRDQNGFTQAKNTAAMKGIPEFIAAGASLGDLWMEGHFEFGDPLKNSGAPAAEIARHMNPETNQSKSFQTFVSGIKAMFPSNGL